MKKTNIILSVLVLLVLTGVGFCAEQRSKTGLNRGKSNKIQGKNTNEFGEKRQQRSRRINGFKSLTNGKDKVPELLHQGRDGHLSVAMAKRGSYFDLPGYEGKEPKVKAKAFVDQWKDLLCDTDSNVEYEVAKVVKSPGGGRTKIHLQQTYQGIEVFGGVVVMGFDREANVKSIRNEAMYNLDAFKNGRVSLTPEITAKEAQEYAIEWLQKQYPDAVLKASKPVLKIDCPELRRKKGSPSLVWEMDVCNTRGPIPSETLHVESSSGRVVNGFSKIRYVNIYDNHCCDAPKELVVDPATSTVDDVRLAYEHVTDTINYYSDVHGRSGIDNLGTEVEVIARYWDIGKSFYGANTIHLSEGEAYDENLAHEYTHGVSEYETTLIYDAEDDDEGTIMHEAFSMIWGEFVDLYNNDWRGDDGEPWVINEDSQVLPTTYVTDMYIFGGPLIKEYDGMNWNLEYNPYTGVEINRYDRAMVLVYLAANLSLDPGSSHWMYDEDDRNPVRIHDMDRDAVAELFYFARKNLTTYSDHYQLGIELIDNYGDFEGIDFDSLLAACKQVGIYPPPFDRFWFVTPDGTDDGASPGSSASLSSALASLPSGRHQPSIYPKARTMVLLQFQRV